MARNFIKPSRALKYVRLIIMYGMFHEQKKLN